MKSQNNDQIPLDLGQPRQLSLSSVKPTVTTSNGSVPSYHDPIGSLSLPLRIENALRIHGNIKTVGELISKSDKEVLKIRNIGTKFLSELRDIRNTLLNAGFNIAIQEHQNVNSQVGVDNPDVNVSHQNKPTKEQFDYLALLLEKCPLERDKEVVSRRFGLNGGDKETLEEIGSSFGVTRERIRQIQKRSLLRMQKVNPFILKQLTEGLEELLYNSGGFITDEEADSMIPQLISSRTEDGSSALDLFCDLSLIQSTKLGDITLYSPIFTDASLYQLTEKLRTIVKDENIGISLSAIKKRVRIFKNISDPRFSKEYFILKYCWIDPRIEEVDQQLTNNDGEIYFRHYTSGNFPSAGWISGMKKILESEGSPLHFTEIANKLNDLIPDDKRKIEVRRAHSILIENGSFAHVGIRGTYGLTSWGLRKESMPDLIEECLKKAGFPLHIKQIFQYVGKYKETKECNIFSVLESNNKFMKTGKKMYWLNK